MWLNDQQKQEKFWWEGKNDIEFYAPSYRIVENRIGILLRKQKDFILEETKAKEIFKESICPDAILSTHELGALFFYDYLYKKGWLESASDQYIQNFIIMNIFSEWERGRIWLIVTVLKLRWRFWMQLVQYMGMSSFL